jgi:D-alanyl-D-alanine carboxypeptidase/D-alanyl-D-alanine-endopeptidase (penicillin-binding protein 4)
MPIDDKGANEALAIDDPAAFASALFRNLLEKRGITVYGHERTHHTELARLSTFSVTATAEGRGGGESPRLGQPSEGLVLASFESKPLIEDIRVINKVSQNLHAEILLRLMGREKGTAATIDSGLEVVRGFLTKAEIPGDQYIFYDGSGLSRQNLVTPHAVVALLEYAWEQPWGKAFRDTLPVAGIDGSLADRFRGTIAQGRVYGKTGSLGGVKTLSGYAMTDHGEPIAFSILTNNFNLPAKKVNDAIDDIVTNIVDDNPRPK